MKHPIKLMVIQAMTCLFLCGTHAQVAYRDIKVDHKYLNIPVSMAAERQKLFFLLGGDTLLQASVRLGDGKIDYWVFKDMSAYQGRTIRLSFPKPLANMDKIHLADHFAGEDSLYQETNRPRYHFTTRRGWNNDPNGLIWTNGEYHLFYQHNPYETEWENMHWGHAVSPDLLHWKELDDALFPDARGMMFSGSAVIDRTNTAGWGPNTLVAIYTSDSAGREDQCLAYSHDQGRTFVKYKGNPVWGGTRDPKVFWYAPRKEWVMALYKNAGVSILTSPDLRSWKEQDYVKGFYECPEFFELPIDGDKKNTRWVMYGGSGTYFIGKFDGRKFLPLGGKYRTHYGSLYAAQTYNDEPKGRRVQIGWGRIPQPGMPFNQMMLFPTELSLRKTPEGIRLFSEPIAELSRLQEDVITLDSLAPGQINDRLRSFGGGAIRLKGRIEFLDGTPVEITFGGKHLLTIDSDEVNGIAVPLNDPSKLIFDIDLLIDRTSFELFYQQGKINLTGSLPAADHGAFLEIRDNGGKWRAGKLQVSHLRSIWDPQ